MRDLDKAVKELDEAISFEVDNVARCFRVNVRDLIEAYAVSLAAKGDVIHERQN